MLVIVAGVKPDTLWPGNFLLNVQIPAQRGRFKRSPRSGYLSTRDP
jgi:hypothetical protein